MEVDADRRSIHARAGSMFNTAIRGKSRKLFWTDAPPTVDELQFDWAFAVNVIFRLFGDEQFAGTNLSADDYPPLALRRRIATEYGCQLLEERWKDAERTRILNCMLGSVRAVEESFLKIGAQGSKGGLIDAFSDIGLQHR